MPQSVAEDGLIARFRAAAAGERSAVFQEIFQAHRHQVFGLCLRLCGQVALAEDATQETFLEVYRGLPLFRGGASLGTWIYRVALRTALRLRARMPGAATIEEDSASTADPEVALAARDDIRAVQGALDALPAEQRVVVALFSIDGLAADRHRLMIEVTGTHQPLSGGSAIPIDAFDVRSADGSITRAEEDSPTVYCTPCDWLTSRGALHSGGSARVASALGAAITLDFTGTGVSWIGYRDAWSGIAAVYVDGVFQTEIDTYASPGGAQTEIYVVKGLPPGSHNVTIRVTGRQNQIGRAHV